MKITEDEVFKVFPELRILQTATAKMSESNKLMDEFIDKTTKRFNIDPSLLKDKKKV